MPVAKFEPQTQPLTEKESLLVPYTIKAFKNKAYEKSRFLSSRNMVKAIETEYRIGTGEEVWIKDSITLRKIVNYLVRNVILPIGSSWSGYYLLNTKEEFDEEIESLTNRANALNARIQGLKEFRRQAYGE